MSIGFYLLGEFRKPQLEPSEWLRRLERRMATECSDLEPSFRQGFVEERPCLFCKLYPAAEEVEIALPDPNHVTVSAKTSTVGPGYHIFLCDLLHCWTKDLSITWKQFGPDDDTMFGDEADYFFTRSQPSAYEHMERWLRGLTGAFFEGVFDPEAKEIALCMPENVQLQAPYLAVTQLGPRDRDWLLRMSQGAVDYGEFYPWYEAGVNANYYLGRALVHMWSDIRWRKPVNAGEEHLIESVLTSLRVAHQMNPHLDFPWNEWSELHVLSRREVPDYVRENASGSGRIGYRRNSVRTLLPGNWRIETEGSFSDFEPSSDGSLLSVEPPREIWFTAYSFSADDPEQTFHRMRDKALDDWHELVNESENYFAVADINTQRKYWSKYYLLTASNVGVLCRSVLTLVFREPADRDWAIRVWKSLTPPAQSQARSTVQ